MFAEINHQKIHYKWVNRKEKKLKNPVIIFLHEGLGSIGQWKNFPDLLCKNTGLQGLVYERVGYGSSDFWVDGIPDEYLKVEGQIVLPQLMEKLNIQDYFLFGHSDGGTLALYHAALQPQPMRAMMVEAPHVIIEENTEGALREVRDHPDPTFIQRLDKYQHGRAAKLIQSWTSYWLRPKFAQWNMVDELEKITHSGLLIQGEEDHFGSFKQLDTIAEYSQGKMEQLRLNNCRHIPHLEKMEEVLKATQKFIYRFLE